MRPVKAPPRRLGRALAATTPGLPQQTPAMARHRQELAQAATAFIKLLDDKGPAGGPSLIVPAACHTSDCGVNRKRAGWRCNCGGKQLDDAITEALNRLRKLAGLPLRDHYGHLLCQQCLRQLNMANDWPESEAVAPGVGLCRGCDNKNRGPM